jgi:hypothetical protein
VEKKVIFDEECTLFHGSCLCRWAQCEEFSALPRQPFVSALCFDELFPRGQVEAHIVAHLGFGATGDGVGIPAAS